MQYPFLELSKEIIEKLKQLKYTVSTAESCTGGRISGSLTSISGSSDVVRGGICAYCDEIKNQCLHVKKESLEQYTAVSDVVCKEMNFGIRTVMNSNCALSSTGYADEIGLIFVSASVNDKFLMKELHLKGSRLDNTHQAVLEALQLLLQLV